MKCLLLSSFQWDSNKNVCSFFPWPLSLIDISQMLPDSSYLQIYMYFTTIGQILTDLLFIINIQS